MEKLKDLWNKNWKQYGLWLLICGALYVLYLTGYLPGFNPPSPPVPIFQPEQFRVADGNYDFGWQKDDDAVKAVAATLPFKVFADTPAGQQAAIPDHFYQWEVYRKCDPRGPPTKSQGSVGSCVSFGTNNAILRTMAGQIVLGNANEELKDIAEEVTYAGSRVEVGKGRIRGDGSVGAWAAQFVQQYGVIAREKHGQYDLSVYDQARCRAWGSSGVPAELEAVAKLHPVKDITQIKTTEELKGALAQGYGVAVCSNQGFSMKRDSRGVARASGSWAHCMCIDGYHTEGNALFFHIENSWGPNAHTGPVGWGNPSTAGFWAEAAVVQRMLNAGDTWAFSGVKGFPARESEWFVQRKSDADTRLALHRKRSFPCSEFLLAP
jgi:hypothetical protein